ncbi:MAG: hypothetical protein IPK16_12105 [Anaerolineales bacterium]|nr:hypothetical protein [Anaerolineales bacterium]
MDDLSLLAYVRDHASTGSLVVAETLSDQFPSLVMNSYGTTFRDAPPLFH